MKKELLYEGKAKKIYATEKPDEVICEYKDSLTAFNGAKASSEEGKGALNLAITTLIFEELENHMKILTDMNKKLDTHTELLTQMNEKLDKLNETQLKMIEILEKIEKKL